MFDIGGWEFLVIVILAIVVIGPKDLPAAVRAVTLWARKARALAADFRSGLDDIAREVELDKIESDIRDGLGGSDLGDTVNSMREDLEHSIDPEGEIKNAFNPHHDASTGSDDDLHDADAYDGLEQVETAEPETATEEGGAPDKGAAVADGGEKAGA